MTRAHRLTAAGSAALLSFGVAAAQAQNIRGSVSEFRSPSGTTERCIAAPHIPGGAYSSADESAETSFCSIDFYGTGYALCPKVFSTSPATFVYDLSRGSYAGDPSRFEQAECRVGNVSRAAAGPPIDFKMSVNTAETSATFAISSLVYYHFSRYFDATAHVPVAVFRTMDAAEHDRRVSSRGVDLSAGKPALKMNHAAWTTLRDSERNPSTYRPTRELFTDDGQVYGVLLHPRGERYGEEMNGTRDSGWGDGQNRDFQETAPFRALRVDAPLLEAVRSGVAAARRNPKLAKATAGDTSVVQMVFWMADLIDVTLLDYIFSQQDRVGNVDFIGHWYWVDGSDVRSRVAENRTVPEDMAAGKPVYVKRTELGDNDAGVRTSYTNFAKRTGMLEDLRHYRATTYRQLMRLDADFRAKGPLYEYTRTSLDLSERELAQTVTNVSLAAGILRDACLAGRLRFDIEPLEVLRTGSVVEQSVDCRAP